MFAFFCSVYTTLLFILLIIDTYSDYLNFCWTDNANNNVGAARVFVERHMTKLELWDSYLFTFGF